MHIFHCARGKILEKSREKHSLDAEVGSVRPGPASNAMLVELHLFLWVVGVSDAQASVHPTHTLFSQGFM